jgi:hypothetical protein
VDQIGFEFSDGATNAPWIRQRQPDVGIHGQRNARNRDQRFAGDFLGAARIVRGDDGAGASALRETFDGDRRDYRDTVDLGWVCVGADEDARHEKKMEERQLKGEMRS